MVGNSFGGLLKAAYVPSISAKILSTEVFSYSFASMMCSSKRESGDCVSASSAETNWGALIPTDSLT